MDTDEGIEDTASDKKAIPLLPQDQAAPGEPNELVIHVPEKEVKTAEIGVLSVLAAIILIASAIAVIFFIMDRRRQRKIQECVEKIEKTEEGKTGNGRKAVKPLPADQTMETTTTEEATDSEINTEGTEEMTALPNPDDANNNRNSNVNTNAAQNARNRRLCLCVCCPPEKTEPSLEEIWQQKKSKQKNVNVSHNGEARQSLKLMEKGMKHVDHFQKFLKHSKHSTPPSRGHRGSNRHRRYRSESVKCSHSRPVSPQKMPGRASHSHDKNRSCWNQASSKWTQRRSSSGDHNGRSHSRQCRSQGHSEGRRSRSKSCGRYGDESQSRYGKHDRSQSHHRQVEGHTSRGHSQVGKTSKSQGQTKELSTRRHKHTQGSPTKSCRTYNSCHEHLKHNSDSAEYYNHSVSPYDNSQYHCRETEGRRGEKYRDRNHSANRWSQQYTHSTPIFPPPNYERDSDASCARSHRTIPRTRDHEGDPYRGYVEYPWHYTNRYGHLNVSQNYNCEDSDMTATDTAKLNNDMGDWPEGRKPDQERSDELNNDRGDWPEGRKHDQERSDELKDERGDWPEGRKPDQERSDELKDESSDTGTHVSRKSRHCRRGRRSYNLRHRNAASQVKPLFRQYQTKDFTGHDSGKGKGRDDNSTSTDDSDQKDETVSLAQKLFGLKLTSRKRPSRRRHKKLLAKKRQRGAETRPLLGSPSSLESEDMIHKLGIGTEPMDSGYGISASFPSETQPSDLVKTPALAEKSLRTSGNERAIGPLAQENSMFVRRRSSGQNAVDDMTSILRHSDSHDLSQPVLLADWREKEDMPVTGHSKGKVCTTLNPADLSLLSYDDHKEFRMMATQKWCEQQSHPEAKSSALGLSDLVPPRQTHQNENMELLSAAFSSVIDIKTNNLSGFCDVLKPTSGECPESKLPCKSVFDSPLGGQTHVNKTINNASPFHSRLGEGKEFLADGSRQSEIDFMDFKTSPNVRNTSPFSPKFEKQRENNPRQVVDMELKPSSMRDSSAVAQTEHFEHLEFMSSKDIQGANEMSTKNASEIQRHEDNHGKLNMASVPSQASGHDKTAQDLDVSTEFHVPSSKIELCKSIPECKHIPAKKCLFPGEDKRQGALMPAAPTADSGADYLSPSVLPPCGFLDNS